MALIPLMKFAFTINSYTCNRWAVHVCYPSAIMINISHHLQYGHELFPLLLSLGMSIVHIGTKATGVFTDLIPWNHIEELIAIQ